MFAMTLGIGPLNDLVVAAAAAEDEMLRWVLVMEDLPLVVAIVALGAVVMVALVGLARRVRRAARLHWAWR